MKCSRCPEYNSDYDRSVKKEKHYFPLHVLCSCCMLRIQDISINTLITGKKNLPGVFFSHPIKTSEHLLLNFIAEFGQTFVVKCLYSHLSTQEQRHILKNNLPLTFL